MMEFSLQGVAMPSEQGATQIASRFTMDATRCKGYKVDTVTM
jgi:hypothetical protein